MMYHIKEILKRIMPVVLAVCIISGIVPVFADTADAMQTKNENALEIVTALNIMDSGREGGEILSLQELANIEARLKHIDLSIIRHDMKGDALYSDAIKVIVTALGYNIALGNADNDECYQLAVQLKLLDGVSESDGNITRLNMARMLYNALELPMMVQSSTGANTVYEADEDTTLLDDIFEGVHGDGIITNTPYSTYTANGEGNRNVYIDGELYIDSMGIVPAGYLGYYVDFYAVKNDYDEYELVLVKKNNNKNDVITVDAEDISEKSTREQLIYTTPDNKREKKVEISSDAVIIYNGIPTKGITDIYPDYGSVTVLDSNNDGDCDCVIIEAYEVMYAQYVDTENNIIYDYENGITLDLSDVEMYEIYKDGRLSTLAAISKDDILLLASSWYSFGNSISDAEAIAIYASNYKIRGTVRSIDDDCIYINNEEYKISDAVRKDLRLGIYVELELDYFGRVSRWTAAYGADNYGYIVSYGPSEWRYEDNVWVRMFTHTGEMKVFNLNDDIIYSGYLDGGEYVEKKKISDKTFLNTLKSGAVAMEEVVTYTENTDGTLKSIWFADESNVNDPIYESNSVFLKNFDKENVTARNIFVGTSYRIDSGTLMFKVPTGSYDGNEEDYSIYQTTSFDETKFSRVKVYNAAENKVAQVVVLQSDDSREPSEIIGNNVFVINSVAKFVNDDEEEVVMLKGIQAGAYKTITFAGETMKVGGGKWYSLKRRTSDDLEKGDVIQYGIDADGYVNSYQVLFVPSAQAFGSYRSVARDNNGYLSGLNTIEGRVTETDGHSFMVEGIDFSLLANEGSVTVYSNGKAEAGNPASISVGDYVFIRCNRLYARDIVVYK